MPISSLASAGHWDQGNGSSPPAFGEPPTSSLWG
jgi:hypothetical protein